MLVLSRQRNESILIGDGIEITILDVRGDRVRVGVTAPTEVPVFRKELLDGSARGAGRFVASRSGSMSLRYR
ncbi:MAG TPA: carbon storage regulator [Phycisphaerae bacterium]